MRLEPSRTWVSLCLGLVLSAVSTAPALAFNPPTYQVAPGDTLSAIARRFGTDLDTLAIANSIDDPDRIVIGQQLTIPPQIIAYTVRPGDTLIEIATRFGLDVPTLLRWNEVGDPDLIVVGNDLLVPGYPALSGPSQARSVNASPVPIVAPAIASETGARPRSFPAVITAYSYQAPIGGARGTVTRSGTPVRWGVVAVDPQAIPLGTRLMIDGFDDVFVAEDTGGAVRGNHVEIFYPDVSAALRFGVQTRRVTILG